MRVVIIDYGLGNPSSIKNMFKKIGCYAEITNNKEIINDASHIVLPGVGHFKKGMELLSELDLINVLEKKVLVDEIPFLGICLGMQLLSVHSEEGDCDGLGWIEANTIKFEFNDASVKIPHMGWADIAVKKQNLLFNNLEENARFYFVHAYHIVCEKKELIIADATYSENFCAAVQFKNIFGVQFHPEKSHKYGMQLLKNFAAL